MKQFMVAFGFFLRGIRLHFTRRDQAILMALFLCVALIGRASAAPQIVFAQEVFKHVIAACILTPGSGDEVEQGVATRCTSTALTPTLADWQTPFQQGNFDLQFKPPLEIPKIVATFQSTFDLWNKTHVNSAGPWVLKNGGNLDLTFVVTPVASAEFMQGGLDFLISLVTNPGYVGPPARQLLWSQAVFASYSPDKGSDLNPPSNVMDTFSVNRFPGNCSPIITDANLPGPNNSTPSTFIPNNDSYFCDPVYSVQLQPGIHSAGSFSFRTFQNGFYDGPRAVWPDESFRAITLLSTVTYVTDMRGDITERQLTVYNGISWGFDLSVCPPAPPPISPRSFTVSAADATCSACGCVPVPEPSTNTLLMLPVLLFLLAQYGRSNITRS